VFCVKIADVTELSGPQAKSLLVAILGFQEEANKSMAGHPADPVVSEEISPLAFDPDGRKARRVRVRGDTGALTDSVWKVRAKERFFQQVEDLLAQAPVVDDTSF
jgi:hypothetical protein